LDTKFDRFSQYDPPAGAEPPTPVIGGLPRSRPPHRFTLATPAPPPPPPRGGLSHLDMFVASVTLVVRERGGMPPQPCLHQAPDPPRPTTSHPETGRNFFYYVCV
jgi:hypothetical protein